MRAEFGEAERAEANAEPVAARSSGRRSRLEDSPLRFTQRHPADEPGRRVVAALFTRREARATWVLRGDDEVFERELQQRQQVQLAEWNLREQELNDRYADWEARMNAIVSRGQSGWGNSENLFLQERREWERKMDADRAAGESLWAERQREHFDSKQDWETQIRNQVVEGNVTETLAQAVDNMNAQITQMNANMGTNLETEDRQALIAQAISEIQQDEPSEAEKLAKLNETIAKFNTNVSISELTGTNLGKDLGSITGDYREAMRKQRHDMQVYANTKVFEQYQRLVDDLLEQIEAQNRATAARTVADASAEGFAKAGAFFIKSDSGGKSFAVVNEFVGFDGVAAIQQEQARAGAMHGLRQSGEPSAFNNDQIVAFLENADSIQVASFFDYQTKAFEIVAERIMGAGTGEEREAAYKPNETIHGRLGVWIGRPANQQVTQGLIQAAAGSYYNDQEALKTVAQSATGYGELGASSLRPSQVGVGFYTQLWWYSEQLGKKQNEAISAPLNAGVLGTGAAKFYNRYNPFVGLANSYRTGKMNKELYGVDQANFWRNEILSGTIPVLKADQQTGDLDTQFSMKEWIGLIPFVGGAINSGIHYDEKGNQRRGGFKADTKAIGAAAVTAAASYFLSIYGAFASSYFNKQTFGEEYSQYDNLGVNEGFGGTISSYIGAITAAIGMETARGAEAGAVPVGEIDIAEAARATANTYAGAGILQGAGYMLQRGASYVGNTLSKIGAATGFSSIRGSISTVANTALSGLLGGVYSGLNALSSISERISNGIGGKGFKSNGQLAQARQAYDHQMMNSLDDTSRDNAAQKMRESGLYTEKEIEQMQVASAVIGMQERQIGATTYDWQDSRGNTSTRYANLAGKLAKEGNRTVLEQMQLDAFANFPEEMIKNGITDPTKISPEQANEFAEQIQRKIHAGEPVRHFAGAGYTAQTHDAFALSRAANRVGLSEAQAMQGAVRLSALTGALVTPEEYIASTLKARESLVSDFRYNLGGDPGLPNWIRNVDTRGEGVKRLQTLGFSADVGIATYGATGSTGLYIYRYENEAVTYIEKGGYYTHSPVMTSGALDVGGTFLQINQESPEGFFGDPENDYKANEYDIVEASVAFIGAITVWNRNTGLVQGGGVEVSAGVVPASVIKSVTEGNDNSFIDEVNGAPPAILPRQPLDAYARFGSYYRLYINKETGERWDNDRGLHTLRR